MKWICPKASACPLNSTKCHALVPHEKKPWCEYGCREVGSGEQVAGPCVVCDEALKGGKG